MLKILCTNMANKLQSYFKINICQQLILKTNKILRALGLTNRAQTIVSAWPRHYIIKIKARYYVLT